MAGSGSTVAPPPLLNKFEEEADLGRGGLRCARGIVGSCKRRSPDVGKLSDLSGFWRDGAKPRVRWTKASGLHELLTTSVCITAICCSEGGG